MVRRRSVSRFISVVVALSLFVPAVFAQERPPVSPGVAKTVLLGLNSIQLDRDVAVVSGDVVVNAAATTPVLGEKELSLDRGANTAADYRVAANGIDLDGGATVGGDAYYNTLTNGGTIAGMHFTPLALPVFAQIPYEIHRPSGTTNVTVPAGVTLDIAEGEYGALVVETNATARLLGGGYTFTSISIARGGGVRFVTASNVVVNGNVTLATEAMISPASGSSITASAIEMQVHGSMSTGQDCAIFANVFVTVGSLTFGQHNEAVGSFIARDIRAQRSSHFTLLSSLNTPPTANSQNVFTNGATPVTITLTGSDPEGTTLTFAIVSGPTQGSLSALTQVPPSSATVVYTPATANNLEDSFTFRVTDAGGATGIGVVRINPPDQEPEEPATTVVANDGSAVTSKDVAATLLLTGNAPTGVPIAFSIVPSSGPSNGTLGSVVQGTEVPQRTATVSYTPNLGFTGSDSFQFEACGVIASVTVCDTATFSIQVLEARSEPEGELVTDFSVSTPSDTELAITLFSDSSNALVLQPLAATLEPAEVAGLTADSNSDGIGDNTMVLPAATPVFMSAAVSSVGGPGSNGTSRIHMEFDISGFNGSVGTLQSATVILPTHRGTTDALDTFFWASASDGDGALTNSDYAITAEQIGGVVMPVPPLEDMPLGSSGTFSFSVFPELKAAVEAGFDHLVIQGRVNETLSSGRGLEVHTTATSNTEVPSLALTTPGISPPTTLRILTLPTNGVLRDSANNLITSVPYTLPDRIVKYTSNLGFVGSDQFQFEVDDSVTVDTAFVNVFVTFNTCGTTASGCFNGREP